MKKTALFTAMALSAAALGGSVIPAEAAGSGQAGSYNNVIVIQGNGLSSLQETLDSLKEKFPGGFPAFCRPILPPCPPETNIPGPDTPDQPDTDIPDTDTPDSPDQPDTDIPDADKPKPGPDTGTDGENPDDGTRLTYAEQVVYLVNVERKKLGLSTLDIREDVRTAAQVRALEIQTSFSHTRPDGRSFSTALKEQNVSYRGSGENIAWGQKSPQEVVAGWMNSEGHRANILNPGFTSIGVGHYQNAAGVNYWTQLFIY